MGLFEKSISGIKWSFSAQVVRQSIQLLTTIILARLLAPSDYGLLGMAMVMIGFLSIFSDLGTSSAVVYVKVPSEKLLSSVFWMNVLIGLFSASVVWIASPWISEFYNEQRLVEVLRMLSFSYVFGSVGAVHQAILTKQMDFNALARCEIFAATFSSVGGILAAFAGLGVWSLVVQSLSLTILTTISLWLCNRWRPSFVVCPGELRQVFSYSMNLTGFNITNYLRRNLDYLIIGKVLGAQDLGYYTLAYRIMLYPLQTISGVIGKVMFPFYARIQDDDLRFQKAYLKVAGSIAIVSFPMMLGLWAVAGDAVVVLLGENWAPVATLLLILAPLGMLQSVGAMVGNIYTAKGRTDVMFRWNLVSTFIVVLSFIAGVHWGINGVAIAYLMTSLILMYPGYAIPFRYIGLSVGKYLRSFDTVILCSSSMCLVVLALQFWLDGLVGELTRFVASICLGVVVYMVLTRIFNWPFAREMLSALLPKQKASE
jgi:PST family polysaccharide transporter